MTGTSTAAGPGRRDPSRRRRSSDELVERVRVLRPQHPAATASHAASGPPVATAAAAERRDEGARVGVASPRPPRPAAGSPRSPCRRRRRHRRMLACISAGISANLLRLCAHLVGIKKEKMTGSSRYR